jgi:hypothetical protein
MRRTALKNMVRRIVRKIPLTTPMDVCHAGLRHACGLHRVFQRVFLCVTGAVSGISWPMK